MNVALARASLLGHTVQEQEALRRGGFWANHNFWEANGFGKTSADRRLNLMVA
jgi:hypothetical protein